MTIDAHQHFWDVTRATYPWMGDHVAALSRTFSPSELEPQLAQSSVSATVVVQARGELAETHDLLALAGEHEFVSAVVGWVGLESPDVGDAIDELLASPLGRYLTGARHQVEDEFDDHWLARPQVVGGLRAVGGRGLTYDLLLRDEQIPAALRTIDLLTGTKFVLDHFAKPYRDPAHFDHWRDRMVALAARPNVYCKWSGFTPLISSGGSGSGSLGQYFATLLELFGADRIMFGSDWPVCTLDSSYSLVCNMTAELMTGLSDSERSAILGRTATTFYNLVI